MRLGFAITQNLKPEISGLLAVTEVPYQEVRIPPIFFHFDPGSQIDLGTHKLLTIVASHSGDLLKHSTLLANNNTLMAAAFAVNGGIDVDYAAVTLREPGDFHSSAVRDFLLKAPQKFFTDDLSHDLTLRLIRGYILREQERSFLGILTALLQQGIDSNFAA